MLNAIRSQVYEYLDKLEELKAAGHLGEPGRGYDLPLSDVAIWWDDHGIMPPRIGHPDHFIMSCTHFPKWIAAECPPEYRLPKLLEISQIIRTAGQDPDRDFAIIPEWRRSKDISQAFPAWEGNTTVH